MKKLITITCESHPARLIERKHGDKKTVRWIGAPKFEAHQMFMVDGNAEILLELAANLEIDNVTVVTETDYTEPNSDPDALDLIEEDEVKSLKATPTCHQPWEENGTEHSVVTMEAAQNEAKELSGFDCDHTDPLADMSAVMREGNVKIHIWFDATYAYSTFKFPNKAAALKEIRSTNKGIKITAYAGNAFRDREAQKNKEA